MTVDEMQDGVIVADVDNHAIYSNDCVMKMLDLQPEYASHFEEMFADWTNLDYLGCYPDKTTFTHKPMLVIKSWHYLCTYLITKKNFKTARIITTYEPIRQSVKDLLDFSTVEQFAEYCRDRNIENIQIGG